MYMYLTAVTHLSHFSPSNFLLLSLGVLPLKSWAIFHYHNTLTDRTSHSMHTYM